jgi:hypothetical protein
MSETSKLSALGGMGVNMNPKVKSQRRTKYSLPNSQKNW